jgi:uncharacterized protein
MRAVRAVVGLIAALALSFGVAAAEIAFPPLTGRVVDQAHLLSPTQAAALTARLAAHEQATGQQVVVATVASLQGQEIEEYGYRLGRAWGIGQKDKNTGAILLVAPNERRVRIEVGYGLEGTLTDALSRRIIEGAILPRFRAGQMDQGIVEGTIAMLAVLGGDPDAVPQPPAARQQDPGTIPPVALIVLFLIFVFLSRRGGGFLWWFPVFGPTMWRGGGRRSDSGGFGGFGGGGGSFGGGGASGRW